MIASEVLSKAEWSHFWQWCETADLDPDDPASLDGWLSEMEVEL